MPLFSYIARTSDGRIERGTLTAESSDDVREMLRKKSWSVEDVTETTVPSPVVEFSPGMPWTTIEDAKEKRKTEKQIVAAEKDYAPLLDTFRLFAGWLLAWYGIVYILGDLESGGHLPTLPFIDALYTSSLVLRFTFGTFLFLLLSSIHIWTGRGIWKGIVLTIFGVIIFMLFHWNVP